MNITQAVDATRVAIKFEGYANARRTKQKGLDPEHVHMLAVVEEIGDVEHEITTSDLEAAAAMLREQSEGLSLSESQRRDVSLALSELPFGGLVMHRFPRRDTDDGRWVEQLVDTIKGFGVELRKICEQHERERDELRALQLQQQQTRRFLGLDSLQHAVEQLQSDVAAQSER